MTTAAPTRLRTLIVDNQAPPLAGMTDRVAQDLQVTVAVSAAEARRHAAEQPVDLALISTAVDDIGGLVASLKGGRRSSLVVLVAPSDSSADIEPWLRLGADEVLGRSDNPRQFGAQLSAYVQWLRLQEALESARVASDKLAEEQQRLTKFERDVQIGRRIQQDFLPEALPALTGWEIASAFEPAREVSGDFYDAFLLAQGRRLGVVIGDVCDKGVGAALFMSLFRSLLRAFAQQQTAARWIDTLSEDHGGMAPGTWKRKALPAVGITSLKNAMELTNDYIATNHARSNMFATIFFGVLNQETGALAYINAGHEPAAIIDAAGQIVTRLEPTGPAVGIIPGLEFEVHEAQLRPGETLFAYSDGVTDARSPEGKQFREPRVLELIAQPAPTAAALVERVGAALKGYIGSAPQFDDITMIAVRRAPAAGE